MSSPNEDETVTIYNDNGEMATYKVELLKLIRGCGGDWERFVTILETYPRINPPHEHTLKYIGRMKC